MADPVNILSLYSGSGMHDDAVRAGLRVLGYDSRILGYVEREASAAAWLLGRMEAAALEPAPVFCGDLADLDARPMRGHVDIVVASPPCQPYSSAGRQRGESDDRSYGDDGRGPLWHTVRIIDECRPALVWFENVSEWVTGGTFQRFGDELSRVGYRIQSPIFLAAEDVGAPHQRERVFILAHTIGREWQSRSERVGVRATGRELADGDGTRRETAGRCRELQFGELGLRRPQLGNASSARREGRRNGNDSEGWEKPTGHAGLASRGVPMFPPGRNDYRRWAELVAGGLDTALMPCVERGLQHVVYGTSFSRADVLRLSGNSIVPLAAGVAFVEAMRRLGSNRN